MTVRIRPSVVLLAAGLALSGCIDVECPAEFARPRARERFCGHTGDYAVGAVHRPYAGAAGVTPTRVTTTATTTTTTAPPPVEAPPPAVSVQPVPPPSGSAPTQIR